MTSPPPWPFSIPDPPDSMKQLATEMRQMSVALAEAGFPPAEVLDYTRYLLVVGIGHLRDQAQQGPDHPV